MIYDFYIQLCMNSDSHEFFLNIMLEQNLSVINFLIFSILQLIMLKLFTIFFLLLLKAKIQCNLQLAQTFGSSNWELLSMTSTFNHFIILGISTQSGQNYPAVGYSSFDQNNIESPWMIYITFDPCAEQIRTSDFNKDLFSSYFLIFRKDKLSVQYDIFSTEAYFFETADINKQIIDACFGENQGQAFILVSQDDKNQNLLWFLYVVLQNGGTIRIDTGIRGWNKQCRVLYQSKHVYIQAQSTFKVYEITPSYDFLLIFQLQFANKSIGMDVGNHLFTLFNSTHLAVYRSDRFSLIHQYDLVNELHLPIIHPLLTAKLLSDKFVVILTQQSMLYQVDIEIHKVVASVSVDPQLTQISFIQKTYEVFLHSKSKRNIHYFTKYKIKDEYRCNVIDPNGQDPCVSCLPTYDLMNETCVKSLFVNTNANNISNINSSISNTSQTNLSTITPNSTNMSSNYSFSMYFNNSYSNISINTFNISFSNITLSNSSNTIGNISNIILLPQSFENYNQNIDNVIQTLDSDVAKSVCEVLGKILSINSMRITPRSLLSVTSFLDDFQLYEYHRNGYPKVVKSFISNINLINEFRLVPWIADLFANVTKIIRETVSIEKQENQMVKSYLDINNQSDPTKIYFISNFVQLISLTLAKNLILFLFLKLLHLTLYYIHSLCSLLDKLYRKIRDQTQWWTLIVALLQSNICYLSFHCGLQLSLVSCFNYQNKWNILILISILFAAFLYTLCFYSLIFRYFKIPSAKILIQRLVFNSHSFLLQPIYIVLRNLLRSFLTGLFLTAYDFQMVYLLVIDLCLVFFIVTAKKYFKKKGEFFVCLMYSIVFFCFDCFFEVEKMSGVQNPHRQIFSLTCFILFILLKIILFLNLACLQIVSAIKQLKSQLKPTIIPEERAYKQNIRQKVEENWLMTKNWRGQNPKRSQIFLQQNTRQKNSSEISQKEKPILSTLQFRLRKRRNAEIKNLNLAIQPKRQCIFQQLE